MDALHIQNIRNGTKTKLQSQIKFTWIHHCLGWEIHHPPHSIFVAPQKPYIKMANS
jgi:hypothetical protein